MTRWTRGEALIEQFLTAGTLQAVRGAQADGQPWIDRAERTAHTAASLVDTDPMSATTLA